MSNRASAGKQLRALVEDASGPIVVPGCGDAISARLVEEAGFQATCISGGWTSGARGLLDIGLITLVEMADTAAAISQAVRIPVLADADTGFGPDVNVVRCVREFERAGVAGIQIEDQGSPKTCGLMADKVLIEPDEMARKIATAIAARSDDEFVIIARTDAVAPEGLERAIERGKAYLESGADMLMVEGLRWEDEIETVATEFEGRRLIFNRTPQSFGPIVPLDRLRGFSLIYFPMHLELASITLQRQLLEEIRNTGMANSFEDRMATIDDFFEVVGRGGSVETVSNRSNER